MENTNINIKIQQGKDGRGYSSIHSIRGVVRPAFQMAVEDDLLVKNPFDFTLNTVIVNDSVIRNALTKKNLDFENKRIIVDHQLQRTRNMQYIIEDPKTSCGVRRVPMTSEVAECFRRILANRKKPKIEPMIAGYSGFLFLDKNDMPMVALHWEKYIKHIRNKYNSVYKVQMPTITPHVCRHTFCSNMVKAGMNIKALQYIMGHSEVDVTLNTYTHLNYDDVAAEMKKIIDMNSKKNNRQCMS